MGGKKYDKVDTEVKAEKFNLKENLQLLAGNKPMLMLMIAFGTDVLANYYAGLRLHRIFNLYVLL